ncbi:hypothetical protein ATANTOWER_028267 [Ataeniobius toweri]|uniref:Uncharacterized protein n=1 Tax=Ataeniobius toweri TaxID=208326 RepID=A0ABU7ATR4_9TELE|nr:hypothetical protein [Ataeniobius toweri]
MRTHKNTPTHTTKRHTTMDVAHSLTIPIHTLYCKVQVQIPQRGNQSPYPGGGPLSSGVETGRPHQPGLVPAPDPANQSQPPINSDLNPMSHPPPKNPNMNLPTGPTPTRTQI